MPLTIANGNVCPSGPVLCGQFDKFYSAKNQSSDDLPFNSTFPRSLMWNPSSAAMRLSRHDHEMWIRDAMWKIILILRACDRNMNFYARKWSGDTNSSKIQRKWLRLSSSFLTDFKARNQCQGHFLFFISIIRI